MPAHPARPDRSWPRCPCPSSTPPPRASRSTWPTSQTSSPAPATTTSTSTPPTPPRAPCAASWLRRSPDPETRLGFLTPRQILLELHDHRPAARRRRRRAQIGRPHVCTPVTNSHLVCRL